ncbi:MAG: hypothetical protein ACI9WS_003172, partial [Paraglaciecola psychrophila]
SVNSSCKQTVEGPARGQQHWRQLAWSFFPYRV